MKKLLTAQRCDDLSNPGPLTPNPVSFLPLDLSHMSVNKDLLSLSLCWKPEQPLKVLGSVWNPGVDLQWHWTHCQATESVFDTFPPLLSMTPLQCLRPIPNPLRLFNVAFYPERWMTQGASHSTLSLGPHDNPLKIDTALFYRWQSWGSLSCPWSYHLRSIRSRIWIQSSSMFKLITLIMLKN